MNELHVNILTPGRLVRREEGRVILEALRETYPALLPERYGNYEPLRRRFDPNRGRVQRWKEGFIHGWNGLSVRLSAV